uniref:Chitin-binding type-2 domain-containing protein n=1 Tax=Anopheles epiroticus TaxID=199890 RepID=A0A182PID5_9DIPT
MTSGLRPILILLALGTLASASVVRKSCLSCGYPTGHQIPSHSFCLQTDLRTYFRHEHECGKFYRCNRGTAYEFLCSEGYGFNEEANACEHIAKFLCSEGYGFNEEANACEHIAKVRCPTDISYASNTHELEHDFVRASGAGQRNRTGNTHELEYDFVRASGAGQRNKTSCNICQSAVHLVRNHPNCPTRNGYYPVMFRHQSDCSKYYLCDHGTAYEIACPGGLHFNTALNVCDYPESVGCSAVAEDSDVAVEKPTEEGEQSVPKVHPNCPAVTGRQEPAYWPHPHDCGKYFGCQWGCVELLSCPAGYRWDDGKKACSLKKSVECDNAEW